MKNYCIYKIENTVNKKIYIGLTNNTERRWRSGGIEYKPKKDNTRSFWNAICKYGWDNFPKTVLEDNLTQKEAEELEKHYIKTLDARNKVKGYNIAEGGNGGRIWKTHPRGMLGKKHKPEFSEIARSNAMKINREGKNTNWKNGHPKGMLGKTHSKEYIEKLKNTPTGEHPSSIDINFIYPTGEVKSYTSMKEAVEDTGLTMHFLRKRIKEGTPYIVSPQTKGKRVDFLEKFTGLVIKKSDNTEIIKLNKSYLASLSIAGEPFKENIILPRVSDTLTIKTKVKMYAELYGDILNLRIKSLLDNKMKSQMQAGALLYDMAVESTRNKEIYETYCAGTKRDQSKIILNEATNMLVGGLLEPKFKCNRTDITHRKSGSFLKPLSKEDGRKGDGTNPATLVVDRHTCRQ